MLKCGQRELDLVKNYTGHEYDQVLRQYYAKNRMYDAGDKRFTAVDPVKGSLQNPMSMVQYLYCLNNPVNFVDPLGLYYTVQREDGLFEAKPETLATGSVKIASAALQGGDFAYYIFIENLAGRSDQDYDAGSFSYGDKTSAAVTVKDATIAMNMDKPAYIAEIADVKVRISQVSIDVKEPLKKGAWFATLYFVVDRINSVGTVASIDEKVFDLLTKAQISPTAKTKADLKNLMDTTFQFTLELGKYYYEPFYMTTDHTTVQKDTFYDFAKQLQPMNQYARQSWINSYIQSYNTFIDMQALPKNIAEQQKKQFADNLNNLEVIEAEIIETYIAYMKQR